MNEVRAIAAARHRGFRASHGAPSGLAPTGFDPAIAAWPQGLFAPVPEGHTARSALATSLAFLRLYAIDAEKRGEDTSIVREHIASVEHLI